MSDNKHAGRGGKGYYIALILCAAAIGITSYVYYRNANRVEEVSIQESVGEDILVGTMESEDVPALATQPQTQSTPPATQGTTPAPTAKKPFKTTSPVSGEEISAYSMEALSYNETTRDWRVHNGVDIAADAGTEVCAAADGEVYTVYEDDSMGYTVVIRHDGGYLTRYASQIIVKLKKFAEENKVVVKYESIKDHIRDFNQNAAAKYHFFSPFRSDSPLAEHLKEMYLKLEKQRDSRK